jgi:hypothetical protein
MKLEHGDCLEARGRPENLPFFRQDVISSLDYQRMLITLKNSQDCVLQDVLTRSVVLRVVEWSGLARRFSPVSSRFVGEVLNVSMLFLILGERCGSVRTWLGQAVSSSAN